MPLSWWRLPLTRNAVFEAGVRVRLSLTPTSPHLLLSLNFIGPQADEFGMNISPLDILF
jgi:hypothetical protein